MKNSKISAKNSNNQSKVKQTPIIPTKTSLKIKTHSSKNTPTIPKPTFQFLTILT